MIGLTVIAALVAVFLITNAGGALSRVSAIDRSGSGPWGIVSVLISRRRKLTAPERRWQTQLTAADKDETRWRDLVEHVGDLERSMGATPPPEHPPRLDHDWLSQRLDSIETQLGLHDRSATDRKGSA